MKLIQTILCFAVVVLTMTILIVPGLIAFTLSFLGLKNAMLRVFYHIGKVWSRLILWCTGCSVEVRGTHLVPPKGGLCFVSNHCSIVDILLLLGYAGRPLGFIAKKELLFIPLLNFYIYLLNGLFMDRKNPRKALKTIAGGAERLRRGGAIVIFPEGHRSRGQGLLPFHPGALKLATQAGVQVQPVAISGTYELFEKTYRVQKVPLSITFCEPIPTADLRPEERKQILCDRIKDRIAEALVKEGSGREEEAD